MRSKIFECSLAVPNDQCVSATVGATGLSMGDISLLSLRSRCPIIWLVMLFASCSPQKGLFCSWMMSDSSSTAPL